MMAPWQRCDRQAAMSHQTNPITLVLMARIPAEGVADFRAYEDAVLPLLPEFNGRLQRRLRNLMAPSRCTSSASHPMQTFKTIGMTLGGRVRPPCWKNQQRSWKCFR